MDLTLSLSSTFIIFPDMLDPYDLIRNNIRLM